jgi:hypothetical protein
MRYLYRPDDPRADEFGMIEAHLAVARETGSAVQVIRDEMEATRHMADGKYYTSKAKFRAATRAHGCLEVGNETETLLKPRSAPSLSREQRKDDIRRAIEQLRGR